MRQDTTIDEAAATDVARAIPSATRIGDDVCFLMAPAGAPRPTDFTPGKGTLSRWRRR